MDKQEYLYNNEYVTISRLKVINDDVDYKDSVVIVQNDYGDFIVADKSNLIKKEDSYSYKRAQERVEELRSITAEAEENFEKVVERVISAVCSTLSSRMKMNILFSDGLKDGG
jgi:acetone carboxylase gamma subunit